MFYCVLGVIGLVSLFVTVFTIVYIQKMAKYAEDEYKYDDESSNENYEKR